MLWPFRYSENEKDYKAFQDSTATEALQEQDFTTSHTHLKTPLMKSEGKWILKALEGY